MHSGSKSTHSFGQMGLRNQLKVDM